MIVVLFLFANPPGTQDLSQDEEFNYIFNNILNSRYRNEFQLRPLKQISLSNLRRELSEFEPQTVHFSGADFEAADNYVKPSTIFAIQVDKHPPEISFVSS
jgi:hypothetical protein